MTQQMVKAFISHPLLDFQICLLKRAVVTMHLIVIKQESISIASLLQADLNLQAGDDYLCPLRRGDITLVGTKVPPVTKDIGTLDLARCLILM